VELCIAFSDLFNPETLIRYGGVTLLLVIIFAETGIFFGFFLPGDSLLFIAGMLTSSGFLELHIFLLWFLLLIAAVSGTLVGYLFGRRAAGYFAHRKENFFYKKKYLETTKIFYKRYGMGAFILGRFLPVVRTFVPIFAGMAGIEYGKFIVFNIIGAAIWISTMLFAGYGLGNLFPNLSDHLELIVAGMIILTAIPVIITWNKQQNAKN